MIKEIIHQYVSVPGLCNKIIMPVYFCSLQCLTWLAIPYLHACTVLENFVNPYRYKVISNHTRQLHSNKCLQQLYMSPYCLWYCYAWIMLERYSVGHGFRARLLVRFPCRLSPELCCFFSVWTVITSSQTMYTYIMLEFDISTFFYFFHLHHTKQKE